MTGHVCPECGRQDDAHGRPGGVRGCACGKAAPADGFDPLRVRPYVALPDPADAPDATVAGPPAELTQVLVPGTHGTGGRDGAPEAPPGAAGHGGTYDYRYEHGHAYDVTSAEPDPAAGGRRGGRRVAVAVAAVVAVLGTAAYASGLLAKDGGGDDRALPDSETTAPFVSAAPDTPDASVSASPSATGSASPSASASRSASAPSPTSSSAGPSSSSTVPLAAGPTSPPATAAPTGGTSPTPSSPAPGVTLQRGDNGPEVVELQERLEQVGLYGGRSHGRYDGRVEDAVAVYQYYRGIEDDPEGVYGPATRRALEAETRYPYDGGDGGWDGGGRD
ncbi:peptidoglycan-binding domain-containing protein [Streptomyces wuyuanensis]|uniref:peptidoglycan-binding domain-containing protein n=1 Tax=Streptomyces wuyuanensis TaxID=1196353 RepID=UPI003D75BDAF